MSILSKTFDIHVYPRVTCFSCNILFVGPREMINAELSLLATIDLKYTSQHKTKTRRINVKQINKLANKGKQISENAQTQTREICPGSVLVTYI